MSTQALHGLTCPRCGGTVPVPEGQRLVICPYCDLRSVVSGEGGIRRYQVPLRVEREAAEKAFRAFLSSSPSIASGVAREAQLSEMFLVYLPFWSAWGKGVAWAFGQQRVGSGDNVRYEPRERRATAELIWTQVACDVGEFGVQRIELKGCPLEPFDPETLHRKGMVFEPVGSPQQALQEAQQSFENHIQGKVSLSRTAQVFTRILNPRLGLVYYPVWVVRYLHKQRAYQVVIDGYHGNVLYGKAPGNLLMRALTLVGGMAFGAFLAVDVPALIVSLSGDEDILGLALIALGIGLALMFGGYQHFRHGEHYEYPRLKGKSSALLELGENTDLSQFVKALREWKE